MIAIEEARPLQWKSVNVVSGDYGVGTYCVTTSWKSHTPSSDAATPRTADETMCVMGEVTLMDIKLARLMRKPNAPYSKSRSELIGSLGRVNAYGD